MMTLYTAGLDATEWQLLRSRWRWLLGAGILLALVALVALFNLLLATIVSVLFVGTTMLLAGAAHIVFAFQMKRWGQIVVLLLVGALYLVAALMTFWNPVLASTFLTLLMALSMLVAGIVRTVAGLAIRPVSGWPWLVAAGVATVLVSLIVLAGWPVNSLWIIGALLAIDLMLTGSALSAFALALRRLQASNAIVANRSGA